jgi:hypothetical protein
MIDEAIITALNEKQGALDLTPLVDFLKCTGLTFRDRRLVGYPIGFAMHDAIYLDIKRLTTYANSMMLSYIILHEVGHAKRIAKLGKANVINMLSIKDFDEFCASVISEEVIADRYSSFVYYALNKRLFPKEATQQLHLEHNKIKYRTVAKQLHGLVDGSEAKYEQMINEFLG